MRAVRFDTYGDPTVLRFAEVPGIPEPGPGEVRIAVRAAGVNPWDVKVRSGAMAQAMASRFPVVPGIEAAGVVDAVGPGVTAVTSGDDVLGLGRATNAEYAILRDIAVKPPSLSWEEAAAIPVAAETAVRAVTALGVGDGMTVVVAGASGAVGSLAVQWATALGARVVGVAREPAQERVRALGAEPVVSGAGLVTRVRQLAPGGVDAALDTSGRGVVGDLVTLTGDPSRVLTIADFAAGELGVQVSDGSTGRAPEAIGEVARLAAQGRLVVPLGQIVPWTDPARAHALIESGDAGGRVVLAGPLPTLGD